MTNYTAAYATPSAVYHREAVRLAASLANDATISDGVIRWNSNGRVPPADCVALALYLGHPVNVESCNRARTIETRFAIAAYRRAQAERIPEQVAEQRAEARAAMGPGCDMVNLFTDETFKT